MRKTNLMSAVLMTLLPLTGCNSDQQLEQAARNLSNAAEACLLDVRDRVMKYEHSHHCANLGKISLLYVEAGGGRSDTPVRHQLTAEQARAMAWMARAISASGNPGLSIW